MSLLRAGVQCNKCPKEPNIVTGLRCAAIGKEEVHFGVSRVRIYYWFFRDSRESGRHSVFKRNFLVMVPNNPTIKKAVSIPLKGTPTRAPHAYRYAGGQKWSFVHQSLGEILNNHEYSLKLQLAPYLVFSLQCVRRTSQI